ncbi:hypothetical protein [Burkholderia pseudomallei]|uniref:hypothetical protein n=1 Tax=Burkholderia pseudomallei TaxID=28450 RepID=UPI00100BE7C4|nr:hypothetical protein [Burkholderia pseudomallei]
MSARWYAIAYPQQEIAAFSGEQYVEDIVVAPQSEAFITVPGANVARRANDIAFIEGVTVSGGFSGASSAAVGAAVSSAVFLEIQRKENVERKMRNLDEAFLEDYDRKTDSSSQEGFARFMSMHRSAAQPMLSAESTGKLVATWVAGEECLTLRFQDGFHFQFAISTKKEGGLRRTWGSNDVVTFFERYPDAKRLASGRGHGAA